MQSPLNSSATYAAARAELIASLAKLARRGSRCKAAAFLARSPTKSVSARSLVQDSGARSDI
jgi:hypothetical protein